MSMKKYLLMAMGMAALGGNMDKFGFNKPIFDNSQKIIDKKCPKCGKIFQTKRIGGYMNCKECNEKL